MGWQSRGYRPLIEHTRIKLELIVIQFRQGSKPGATCEVRIAAFPTLGRLSPIVEISVELLGLFSYSTMYLAAHVISKGLSIATDTFLKMDHLDYTIRGSCETYDNLAACFTYLKLRVFDFIIFGGWTVFQLFLETVRKCSQ